MTLKKCAVTQLDDVFWRVDYGTVTRILRSDSGGRFWYEDHGGAARWPSLDDALAAHGLTRHDKPETAEDRVRKLAAWEYSDDIPLAGSGREEVSFGDLRAILAELDLYRDGNRELVRENEVLRSNSDHLSSENASLASQVESMAMRIESLAGELAKPEDVRLREVLDALDGRAVIFDGMGARVTHLLDEMDEWIARAGEAERAVNRAEALLLLGPRFTDVHMEAAADFVLDELRVALRGDEMDEWIVRAGEAERMVEAARRSLSSVAESMTEHAYQELASALEAHPRRGP